LIVVDNKIVAECSTTASLLRFFLVIQVLKEKFLFLLLFKEQSPDNSCKVIYASEVVKKKKDDHRVELLNSTDITYFIKPICSGDFGADLIVIKPYVELN
jgi:hypothetical protein